MHNTTESLWDVWTPAPSWELAFLFVLMGGSVTLLGAWAVWRFPITPVWHGICVVMVMIIGLLQTARTVWRYALLRAKESVNQIEWIWSEPAPVWRVTHRNGIRYDFETWLPDSRIVYWGCCLAYPLKSSRLKFLSGSIVLLPNQIGRSQYRFLCKRILG